jgi:hypothetical protein
MESQEIRYQRLLHEAQFEISDLEEKLNKIRREHGIAFSDNDESENEDLIEIDE